MENCLERSSVVAHYRRARCTVTLNNECLVLKFQRLRVNGTKHYLDLNVEQEPSHRGQKRQKGIIHRVW